MNKFERINDIFQENNSKSINNTNSGYIINKNSGFNKPVLSYINKNQVVTDSNYDTPAGVTNNLYSGNNYGLRFKGFYYLSLLIEDPIISSVIDVLSNDIIKNFGEIVYIGADDPNIKKEDMQEKIKIINKRFDDLKVTDILEQAIQTSLLLGGCGIFIEIANDTNSSELSNPIAGKLSKELLKSITNLKIVDPSFMIPTEYNATNPLNKSFYNPQKWMVLENEVHCSRIPQIIFQKLPYFIRPMYNFQGLSLSQKLEPLINDFYSVKSNIVKITKRMRTFIVMSDLTSLFDPNCTTEETESVINRMKQLKNGDTLTHMLLDKDKEDFKDISSSISGLSDLLSTFAEQICVASQTPISKTWGQTPKGLNSTGDGDMNNYYDMIAGNQRNMAYPFIKYLIELLCIEQFGSEIDGIDFRFNPIKNVNPREKAEIQNLKANEFATLVNIGAITQNDVKKALLNNDFNEFTQFEDDFDDSDDILNLFNDDKYTEEDRATK